MYSPTPAHLYSPTPTCSQVNLEKRIGEMMHHAEDLLARDKMPPPFPYYQFLSIFIYVHMAVVAYTSHQLVEGWFAATFTTFFSAVVLIGLRNVATAYMDPFGEDATDISVAEQLDSALTGGKAFIQDTWRPSANADLAFLDNQVNLAHMRQRHSVVVAMLDADFVEEILAAKKKQQAKVDAAMETEMGNILAKAYGVAKDKFKDATKATAFIRMLQRRPPAAKDDDDGGDGDGKGSPRGKFKKKVKDECANKLPKVLPDAQKLKDDWTDQTWVAPPGSRGLNSAGSRPGTADSSGGRPGSGGGRPGSPGSGGGGSRPRPGSPGSRSGGSRQRPGSPGSGRGSSRGSSRQGTPSNRARRGMRRGMRRKPNKGRPDLTILDAMISLIGRYQEYVQVQKEQRARQAEVDAIIAAEEAEVAERERVEEELREAKVEAEAKKEAKKEAEGTESKGRPISSREKAGGSAGGGGAAEGWRVGGGGGGGGGGGRAGRVGARACGVLMGHGPA